MSNQALTRSITELYATFPDLRDGTPIDGCDHCIDPSDARILGSAPRDAIPERVLSRYAFKAITTWGEARDLRSLIPPVLEALAHGWIHVAPQVTFDRIARAGVQCWSDEERQAIERFLGAWMQANAQGGEGSSAEIVESATIGGFAIEPLLAVWESADAPEPFIELAECVTKGPQWFYGQQPSAPFVAWLRSSRARAMLGRALAMYPDHEYAYLWKDALDAI